MSLVNYLHNAVLFMPYYYNETILVLYFLTEGYISLESMTSILLSITLPQNFGKSAYGKTVRFMILTGVTNFSILQNVILCCVSGLVESIYRRLQLSWYHIATS